MNYELVGWREWIGLPGIKIEKIKAKVDTGATTSSLHAFDLSYKKKRGKTWACFYVHPIQRSEKKTVYVEAVVIDFRKIKSSNGKSEERPVIQVEIEVNQHRYPIELTLTNRDEMGFRMLLGRQALKPRFLVNPSKSYLSLQSKKVIKKLKHMRRNL